MWGHRHSAYSSQGNCLRVFFNLFIFERERGREKVMEGQRERVRERESQAGSAVSAQSLMRGLNSQTVRSWPKLKSRVGCLTNWDTQAPLYVLIFLSLLFSFPWSFCPISLRFPQLYLPTHLLILFLISAVICWISIPPFLLSHCSFLSILSHGCSVFSSLWEY